MKVIYDEKGRLSEVIFNDNDDQGKFWDSYNKTQEEFTERFKFAQTEYTKQVQNANSEYTKQVQINCDTQLKFITQQSLGLAM